MGKETAHAPSETAQQLTSLYLKHVVTYKMTKIVFLCFNESEKARAICVHATILQVYEVANSSTAQSWIFHFDD